MMTFRADCDRLSPGALEQLAAKRRIVSSTATAYDRELVIQQLRENDRVRLGVYTLSVGALMIVVGFLWRCV
jgi:hypothetical protein